MPGGTKVKKRVYYNNGREEIKYQFSAEDKANLSRKDLPIDPCLNCCSRTGCCGCLEARNYASRMRSIFGNDEELIFLAKKIVKLRADYAKIKTAEALLDKKISTLPKQIQPFCKDYSIVKTGGLV